MNRVLKVIVVVALSQICLSSTASQLSKTGAVYKINRMIRLVQAPHTTTNINEFITNLKEDNFFLERLNGANNYRNQFHPRKTQNYQQTKDNLLDIQTDLENRTDESEETINVFLEDAILQLLSYRQYLEDER